MPYSGSSKKLPTVRPSAIQNTTRNAIESKPAAMPTPRMSIAVSERPTMPANIGVKPWNSMYTSTASGTIRYHFSRIARQGLGHWSLGRPSRPRLPASRCTIQNAVA